MARRETSVGSVAAWHSLLDEPTAPYLLLDRERELLRHRDAAILLVIGHSLAEECSDAQRASLGPDLR